MKKIMKISGVNNVYIRSGIRYDLVTKSYNKNGDEKEMDEYMDQLVSRHVSGRLKVAPEHTSDDTLKIMRKPSFKHFHEFKKSYEKANEKHGLNQPLIPYFISSHPGCEEKDMANLAAETKDMGFRLEQVQDFTPTPMTVATIIYYTGVHPYTLRPVYTAKSAKQKKNQHLYFFWYKRENHQLIREKLTNMGREDMIDKLVGDRKRANKKEIIKNRKEDTRGPRKGKKRRS
jgi:uncharacterized radical SAM protein YgiQ